MRKVLKDLHGQPVYPIGVNYWPRRTAVEMWTNWDPERISADLQEIRALGLNTVRFFLRTADFADANGSIDPKALEKLDTFLALCREHGLYALPSFFVGHMSGMNFPIPWEQGRDFYTDPEVLARSRRFVQAIVARYRDEAAILGWLLSNEITNHTDKRETHILLEWMRNLYQAIREIDPRRPIAPGDGADDLKGLGLGYPEGTLKGIEEMKGGEDFVSLHHYYGFYYGDGDTMRFSHAPAAVVRLCDIGLPVLVEEFGVSTALWSEAAQAAYFRVLLFSTWAAGAAGALAWCWSDFPTADLPPYSHQPHELFFGITRADGSEKPAAGEMRRFAHLMGELDGTRFAPTPPQAAILVPNTFYINYPFRNVNRLRLLEILLESYTLVRMASFDVVFIREPALPPEGVRLLLIPYGNLLASTWYDLGAWVEAGGVLWAGFGGAVPNLERLFGVRPGRSPSAFTPPQGGMGELRLVEALGDLQAGEQIALPAANAPYLPIIPTKAKVLAVDGDGRPALTVHSVGRGKAFFCPRSLEWLLTTGIEPNRRSPLHRLYRALRTEAGITAPFEARHPALSLSVLESESGTRLLVAINHSDAPLEEEIHSKEPLRRVLDIESGKELELNGRVLRLSLGPWGVQVLEIGA